MKLFLFILLSFISVTAILSGLMMIGYPDGSALSLSLSLLDGNPFKNFIYYFRSAVGFCGSPTVQLGISRRDYDLWLDYNSNDINSLLSLAPYRLHGNGNCSYTYFFSVKGKSNNIMLVSLQMIPRCT